MSKTTRTKIIISGTAAGLALLGLTAVPVKAQNHGQVTTSTIALHHSQSAAPSGLILAQAQEKPPTQAQMNRMMMEMMQRCNSMMSMMQNMRGMTGRNNMPGMMNNQNSRPAPDMMNRTPRQ